MTLKEAKKLKNGLYKIYWKDGGYSLASIGRLHNGKPWFAPDNWTAVNEWGIACTLWNKIKFVELKLERE